MTIRLSAVAAVVAGLLSLIEGIVQVRYTQPESGWGPADVLFELGFAVALLASIIALHGVPRRLAAGRAARVGTIVAQVGFGVLLVTSATSAAARQNELAAVFPLGLLLVVVGLLVLAIAGALTGRPRWLAIVPLVGFVLSVALPAPALGDSVLGLAWVLLGVVLISGRRAALAVG